MTNREKTLLRFLFLAIYLCGVYITFISLYERINQAETRIDKYTEAINNTTSKYSIIQDEPMDIIEVYPAITINQSISSYLSDLVKYGITATKYQINSENTVSSSDISFSCSASSLMQYFCHEYNNNHEYHLTYLYIKRNANDISGSMSIENLPSEPFNPESDIHIDPLLVCKLFFKPIIQNTPPQSEEDTFYMDAPTETPVVLGNSLFDIVGNIYTEDGTKYLYLKVKSSNKVIKLTPQQILNENERLLLFEFEGVKYEITKP